MRNKAVSGHHLAWSLIFASIFGYDFRENGSGTVLVVGEKLAFEERDSEGMADMISKEQSRRWRAAIRHILMSEWDPIDVKDTPEAADEYDGYIASVLDLLNAEASSDEISAYLLKVETERMGMIDAQGNPILPAKKRDAAIISLERLILNEQKPDRVASPRGFRHWNFFAKTISPAFAKTPQRREQGLCFGCGSNPCKCKNPRLAR